MRTKSRYREIKSDIPPESPAPDIPEVTIDGQGPESIAAVSVEIPEEPPAADAAPDIRIGSDDSPEVTAAIEKMVAADESAQALKRQIEAQHQAELLRRLAARDPRLLSPDERLSLWKANGLSDRETDFLRENPEMADVPALLNHAAALALREHERDSDGYFDAVRANFEDGMRQLQSQAAATAPEFFRPEPPRPPREHPRIPYSAPVSRDVPSAIPRELNPGKITLTAEEVQAAKFSGISPSEYAVQKLKMLRAKSRGEIQ